MPTEVELESMGEVGVDMLERNVASEVTVDGLDGSSNLDSSAPMKMEDELMKELDSDIVSEEVGRDVDQLSVCGCDTLLGLLEQPLTHRMHGLCISTDSIKSARDPPSHWHNDAAEE